VLRSVYERRTGPGRQPDPERFVWDYWHVPGQYTYLRTHARRFFPPAVYGRFLAAVRGWGAAHLGCARISEPWLSFYVHGCRQELHADVPQGPWSFVYSLTDWDARAFTGGETLMLRGGVLDYWSGFADDRPLERDDLLWRVPARFDQLLVFDARVPHGVAAVEGTSDPLRARVVVHGWYLRPALTVVGALGAEQVTGPAEELHRRWDDAVRDCGPLSGVATWLLEIGPDGVPRPPRPLASTLVATAPGADPARALATMGRALATARFPAAAGPSSVVFPVVASAGHRSDPVKPAGT
jgi:hypothetical protein